MFSPARTPQTRPTTGRVQHITLKTAALALSVALLFGGAISCSAGAAETTSKPTATPRKTSGGRTVIPPAERERKQPRKPLTPEERKEKAARVKANAPQGFLLPGEPDIRVLLIDAQKQISLVPAGDVFASPGAATESPADTLGGRAQRPGDDAKPGGEPAAAGAGVSITQLPSTGTFQVRPISGEGPDQVGIYDAAGAEVIRGPFVVVSMHDAESKVTVKDVPFGVGWWWENKEDRPYRGRLEFRRTRDGRVNMIIQLPLEEYLTGVVPQEIGGNSPDAALQAQAVAARSEAVLAITTGKYSGENYDICSDVACQAYSGLKNRTKAADAAVDATRGMVLADKGKPISAYYASNCGGFSETIENVWKGRGEKLDYYTGHADSTSTLALDLTKEADLRKYIDDPPADAWCNPAKRNMPTWSSKNFRWEKVISADELTTRVARKKDIGRVTSMVAQSRGVSGRVITMEFRGEKGTFTLGPELNIRQVFDPPLKSACFYVDPVGPADRPTAFRIRGAGWGHGVGMCQSGAVAMAKHGIGYEKILDHYYAGAKLTAAWPLGIEVIKD